jgi:hypothetical protein
MTVPIEIAEAVRRAAAAVPGHGGDLGTVRRRGLARVRRRRAATAGVAAVVVGAGAVPLSHATGTGPARLDTLPVPPAASPQVARQPVQRLLLSGHGLTVKQEGRPTVGIVDVPGIVEVRPDGGTTQHPASAVDGIYGVVARLDGSLVILGHVDHMPGVQRQDGPWIPGVTFDLVVLDRAGTVRLRRDVRIMGQHVYLAGATADTAYLVRPGGIVAHDLAIGAERPVLPGRSAPLADVAAGRAVLVDPDTGCTARMYDLATGAELSRFTPPAISRCKAPQQLRLSPDGRLVAMTYMTMDGDSFTQRAVVVDVATGRVRGEHVIEDIRKGNLRVVGGTPSGIAWSDSHTLRIAAAVLPPDASRIYRIEELLTVQTLRVGG